MLVLWALQGEEFFKSIVGTPHPTPRAQGRVLRVAGDR